MINNTYIGTVIANDDPNRAGRVKVRIEGITPPVREDSYAYKFPAGGNIAGTLTTNEIDNSRITTLWALVMSPIFGESSMGRFNRSRNVASPAESTNPDNLSGGSNAGDIDSRELSPASQFTRMSDGFSCAQVSVVSKTNPYAHSYMPTFYDCSGKGVFSVPGVGSKVVVSFLYGSAREPIVIGKLNTQTEFEQVHDSESNYPSYPGVYENNS